MAVLYYHTCNPRVLNAQPEHDRAQHIDFSLDAAPALEKLLLAYPKYVTVGKLPGDNDAQRLDVVQVLAYTHHGYTHQLTTHLRPYLLTHMMQALAEATILQTSYPTNELTN